MILKHYQEDKVQELLGKTIAQLNIDGMRRVIVFEAPTGSGKTVMTIEAMCRLCENIANSNCQYSQVAYIWIAPNALHVQSYKSMKSALSETHRLIPVEYDELDLGFDGYIHPGEVFFVNWQSIYNDNRVIVRGSEQVSPIYDIIDRTTREHNIPIVCIIDEEQMFTGKNARQSERVLERINSKVEIRISATPKTAHPDDLVRIDRSLVINEGMIKMNVSLNPALKSLRTDDVAINSFLIDQAVKKRKQLAQAYKKLGININPLLLIQLPNDSSETLSADEESLKEFIQIRLGIEHGMTVENGKLAVWLSGESNKRNLEGIEKNDSMVEALIFKQAIAMGWDCPRAGVLAIFRKLSSESFTIQTVGRIMRMPQQRFYTDPILNIGYVYTDLSADVIRIEPDDMDYIKKLHSFKRDGLQNIVLKSFKKERTNLENNVLRSDFKKIFLQKMAEEWTHTQQTSLFSWDDEESHDGTFDNHIAENRKVASQFILLNVSRVQVEIPTDMILLDDEGITRVENKVGFARTQSELKQVFDKFCSSMLSGWSKSKCMSILESAILDSLETLFGIFEEDAYKVVCSKQNQPKFAELISKILNYYKDEIMPKVLKSKAGYVAYQWSVPEVRDYKDLTYNELSDVANHAMLPCFELIDASKPEKNFKRFLEDSTQYIDWWYKNGDLGSEHFAVPYKNSLGKIALFYVDFIIRMKNGKVFLFDTKTENSDSEAPNKHNGLIDYLSEEWNADGNVKGGVIIEDNQNWKYCPMKIENTTDLMGWDCFYPEQYQ